MSVVINPFVFSAPVSASTGITSFTVTSSSTTSNQNGWEFTTNAAITVTKLRVYVGDTGSQTLRLWQVSDATLLGSVVVTSSTNAWVEGALSSPVALASGQNFIVTTRRSSPVYTTNLSTSYVMNAAVTLVSNRTSTGDSMPTSTITLRLQGIPDIVFTT
jgi:hypothetical protein